MTSGLFARNCREQETVFQSVAWAVSVISQKRALPRFLFVSSSVPFLYLRSFYPYLFSSLRLLLIKFGSLLPQRVLAEPGHQNELWWISRETHFTIMTIIIDAVKDVPACSKVWTLPTPHCVHRRCSSAVGLAVAVHFCSRIWLYRWIFGLH